MEGFEFVYIGKRLVSDKMSIPNNPRGCLVRIVHVPGITGEVEYFWNGGRFVSSDFKDFIRNTAANRVVLDKIFRLREAANLNEEIAEDLLESITNQQL